MPITFLTDRIKAFSVLALGFFTSNAYPVEMATTIRQETLSIPVIESNGATRILKTRVCFPNQATPARVVVINHGSPPTSAERPLLKPYSCTSESSDWFLKRGYLVASPVRRGYGETGGIWSEDYGRCTDPNFYRAGMETARDIDAAVKYLTQLPQARPDGVVVVGQSAGGWGTIAYNSMSHPKVTAMINMAGGRGGHAQGQENKNCRPDRLIKAAAKFGKTSTTPMLWMYAKNDTYFPQALAESLHKAFIGAGGQAEFIQPSIYVKDGHKQFTGPGGSEIWGPIFERYLSTH